MEKTLKILHLEDDGIDADLIMEALGRDAVPCEVRLVQDRQSFVDALREGRFDLLFSDFSLPDFDGMEALALARECLPETPFIFISGAIGEDLSIETLRNGATDYVLKHRLNRLVPAVRRAVREAELREAKKELEAKFLLSQKMEALGRLAGGVVHDFNNLLMVILGHVQLLHESQDRDSKWNASLGNIHQAAETAGLLTRQLLMFTRKHPAQAQTVEVNRVIGDMVRMLSRLIGVNIEMKIECAQDIAPVKADPGMLEQVLMNLTLNARDAMPKGGVITLKSGIAEKAKSQIPPDAEAKEGQYVCITVADNGTGMSAATLAHIFEPFFTTKESGKGTGLGLSTVYGTVHQHGGWVEVSSRPGQGTEFRVFLPAAPVPETDAAPTRLPPGGTRAHETILLVEDSPHLRKLVRIILEEEGYGILEAASGEEALRVWEKSGESIDLLLTDMILPDGMTGALLAEKLTTYKPNLRSVFASGYGLDTLKNQHALPSKPFYLNKPFQRTELVGIIRGCLEAASTEPSPKAA